MAKNILIAGPGTGKTTKVKTMMKDFLSEDSSFDYSNVLILSFTNATINDLLLDFGKSGIPITSKNCMTLHKFAFKISPFSQTHVLETAEVEIFNKIAKTTGVQLDDLCEEFNAITFDNLIRKTNDFIEINPEHITQALQSISWLIIDEYQDFNENEQKLLNLVSSFVPNTLILGDDDQSIYEFKQAYHYYIQNLHEQADIQKMEHENICYRCPDSVIDAASNLIANNTKRIMKSRHKTPNGKSGKIFFKQFAGLADSYAETIKICDIVLQENKTIMVLSPTNHILKDFIEHMQQQNYDKYVDHLTIAVSQELLHKAWLMGILYGNDGQKKLCLLLYAYDTITTHFRKKLLVLIKSQIEKNDNGFIDSMLDFIKDDISMYSTRSIEEYLNGSAPEFVEHFNVAEVYQSIDNLIPKLKNKSVFDGCNVNVMSIHKSKGLSADCVIILGLVEGIIPSYRTQGGTDTKESSRRHLFVGMTRAKQDLYLFSNTILPGKIAMRFDAAKFKKNRRGQKTCTTSSLISELKLP